MRIIRKVHALGLVDRCSVVVDVRLVMTIFEVIVDYVEMEDANVFLRSSVGGVGTKAIRNDFVASKLKRV